LLGSLNDINLLQRSHLLARLAKGDAPACNYTVKNHQYTQGYYLANVIYSPWSFFVKTISNPQNKKEAEFAKMQEAWILREPLVFCNLGLLLSVARLVFGTRGPSGKS
jgi:hypothetical protein